MIYDFYFPEEISIPSKKNSKQIITRNKKPFIISSKNFLSFERMIVPLMRLAYLKHDPIKVPVKIVFEIGNTDKRKRDIDNAITTLLDCLVSASVLADDDTTIVREIVAKHVYKTGFKIEIYPV